MGGFGGGGGWSGDVGVEGSERGGEVGDKGCVEIGGETRSEERGGTGGEGFSAHGYCSQLNKTTFNNSKPKVLYKYSNRKRWKEQWAVTQPKPSLPISGMIALGVAIGSTFRQQSNSSHHLALLYRQLCRKSSNLLVM